MVVGLDDSEHSPAVARVAMELVRRLGLRLTAVHSADPDIFVVGERRRTLLRRGHELLDDLIPAGTPHDRAVELGDAGRLIAAVLQDDAALAVVGSAPVPVVVVPPDSDAVLTQGPAAVVAGVDDSAGAFEALVTAADLAQGMGSELVAVHVGPAGVPLAGADREAHELVQRAVDEADIEMPVRIRCDIGVPAERLAAVAEEPPSAMLVVGSRGHGPLRSALVGSVSSRLAASAPVPVVVVPRGAERVGVGRRLDPVAAPV